MFEFVVENFLIADVSGDDVGGDPNDDVDAHGVDVDGVRRSNRGGASTSTPPTPGVTPRGGEWGVPSVGVAVKAAALKALARGCCPADGDALVPAATCGAVGPLVRALEQLVDIENEMEGVGATTDWERGHVRLAAASALLRCVCLCVL